ncbi:MAG: hypothetical protein VKS61_17520 [Candidatus Sericytochromatia bacterium]|nr:hypothetical protein [Candidatus Sericytochromatia bacterium]
MKPIHLLATLALLAGCSLPAHTPVAGTVPVAGSATAGGLVDLPVELHLKQPGRSYGLQQTPVASDVVATGTYDSANLGALIRAVTVQVITDGVPQSGVLTVPSQASAALYPYATAGQGYARWEIFRFANGITAPTPPTITIRGLQLGKLHRAIVRAYGDGVVPATVYDPNADPAATAAVRLSDDAESTTELDLRSGATLPTKGKLTLSLYPVEATLGPWYADPDTGVYGRAQADVTGGDWISANGLATVTVNPQPATEAVSIDFVGTQAAPPATLDAGQQAQLATLNDDVVNCLTNGGALSTEMANTRLPGGDKVLSIEITLGSTVNCNVLPNYRFVERNSVLASGATGPEQTKRGYKLLTNIGNPTPYVVNLKNGTILSYIKYQ